MTVTLTYDPTLSRVRVDATALPGGTVTALVERSTDTVTWTTVRGGLAAAVSGGALSRPVDDYEFAAGVLNTYRVTAKDAGGATLATETATTTPVLDVPWLKFPTRPFLNRAVVVQDYTDVSRASRTGLFEVIGRTFPVAVSELRGGRAYTATLLTETLEAATLLDLCLAAGEAVFLHVPADCDVPGGYYAVGDVSVARASRKSLRRLFTLPLTEVAAPGPDVAGATSTWNTLAVTYVDWNAVIADKATWEDVAEIIGTPAEVIVP